MWGRGQEPQVRHPKHLLRLTRTIDARAAIVHTIVAWLTLLASPRAQRWLLTTTGWLEGTDRARTLDAQREALEHTEVVVQVGALDERRREVEGYGQVHILRAAVDQQRARLGQGAGGIDAAAGQLLHLLDLEHAGIAEDAVELRVQPWADDQRIRPGEPRLGEQARPLHHIGEALPDLPPVAQRVGLPPLRVAHATAVQRGIAVED